MKWFNVIFTFCLFAVLTVQAQEEHYATSISGQLTIDGELQESHWQSATPLKDFTISYPNFGETSGYNSQVKVLYDNEAIYIGAILYDKQADSISYSLSQRDDVGNADWFALSLDPYANNVTAFTFVVTSAGVELDAIEYPEGPDWSWNAVWRSATKRRDDGWSVEIRIPFSAIRFPNKEKQEWNVNFARQVRRNRELSFWNPVDPAIFGEITQSGILKGIEGIKSPLRLSVTPYVTGYLESQKSSKDAPAQWRQRIAGGLDLKYGLNDAFTLDMTLVPDFGQTTSDQQILNLGPFEIQYNENRTFFLEGMDLFGIGGLFYTRRIGGTPFNYGNGFNTADGEELISSPITAPLINASKISGRTTSGLGIGVFNAVERHTYATIRDSLGNEREVETNPLTNYNVIVLSQNLKNNSSVSFVNTNVLREGDNRDANVSMIGTTLFSNSKDYKLDASVKLSSIFEGNDPLYGHAFNAGIAKVSGQFGYSLNYWEQSDSYDPNDLGFLTVNNSRSYEAKLRWNDFKAGKLFLRKWSNLSFYYEELYAPQAFSYLNVSFSAAGTMRNFLTWGINGDVNPVGGVNHFESRTFGKEVVNDPNFRIGGFYSSDYSKVFALDFRPGIRFYPGTERNQWSINVSPRVRVSDRMFLVWNSTYEHLGSDFGYVAPFDVAYDDQILLGVRNRSIVENSLYTELIFTKRMGMDLRLRHYWQQVNYTHFNQLLDDGVMVMSNYNPVENGESAHNRSYNAFTLDINFRWVFIPGSELRIVYKNNIFENQSYLDKNYFTTFDDLFAQPQINSISMKLLVYVDALYFRRKNKVQ